MLSDKGPFFQAHIGLFQPFDLLVARVRCLATGLAGSQADLTVLGQFPAPGRQLGSIQTLAPQPGTLVAVAQSIGLGQQPLLLSNAEPPTGALL